MNTNTTKPLEKELVNDKKDKNDKNVFVSHSVNDFANDFVNDIDNINDKNVFVSHSTKRTKSIENKSVVLSGVYLQPFWGYSYVEMVFNKGRKTSFDKSSAAALSSSGGGGAP